MWADLISQHDWIVGGNTYQNIYQSNSQLAYQSEILNPVENTVYNAKIGLMYVSDYYYSARPMFWSYPGYSSMGENHDYRAAINNNWLYMGLIEWTISKNSGGTTDSFAIFDVGRVNSINVASGINAVRPCFYLENTVEFSSGNGSKDNPYRLVV